MDGLIQDMSFPSSYCPFCAGLLQQFFQSQIFLQAKRISVPGENVAPIVVIRLFSRNGLRLSC